MTWRLLSLFSAAYSGIHALLLQAEGLSGVENAHGDMSIFITTVNI